MSGGGEQDAPAKKQKVNFSLNAGSFQPPTWARGLGAQAPSPQQRALSDDSYDPPAGHHLTVLKRLGAGAYGTVYAAADARNGDKRQGIVTYRCRRIRSSRIRSSCSHAWPIRASCIWAPCICSPEEIRVGAPARLCAPLPCERRRPEKTGRTIRSRLLPAGGSGRWAGASVHAAAV